MRIKTDGQYDWRNERYERAAKQLGEATKSKGIDAAAAFTIEMLSNLERAIEHPDMTPELAEILSTEQVVAMLHDAIDPSARIVWGTAIDDSLSGVIRTRIVVTGIADRSVV